MPDLMTAFNFTLEFDGVQMASFQKASGMEAENELIEFREVRNGKSFLRKVPGNAKYSDITLERAADTSKALWEWRKKVEDGDIDGARRSGSIVLYDSMKSEVARWNFINGWPSKWTGAELDAGANNVATEKIVITHEGLSRA
jgi:phage tail-like protein